MSLVSTPAIVLRTYRYSETSKIVRLATRDYGVQSAIAKGVLRPRSAFGAALETLSEGGRAAPRVLRIGLPDRYVTHGKPALLHAEVGFTGERIAERIESAVSDPRSALAGL